MVKTAWLKVVTTVDQKPGYLYQKYIANIELC